MMRRLFTTTLVLTGVCSFIFAQQNQGWCGTVGEHADAVMERLIANQEALAENPIVFRDEVSFVPVKFHLIGRTDGTGVISKHRVLDQLCDLNEDFASMDLQFYVRAGFNYIFNTTVYSNHANTENTIMTFQRDNQAMNVFIPEDATPSNQTGPGVVLGYYSPSKDWLVLAKFEVGRNASTVTHEVGHFFSLPHPFHGWEPNPWNLADHGNPVMQQIAPDGIRQVELVDRSNCATAGDRICDTPVDYNFGFGWNNCNYTTQVRDRNNDLIDPEERLFMGYFLDCDEDDYIFSEDQQDLMVQDYFSNSRAYLRNQPPANAAIINDTTDPAFPSNGQVLDYYNDVNLSWTASVGADAYLLQISRVSTFTESLIIYDDFVYGINKVIDFLEANKTYYWRVRPLNAYDACPSFTETQSFTTGSLVSTGEHKLVNNLKVSPNPAQSNMELRLEVESKSYFSGTINLYNAAGQMVKSFGQFDLSAGQQMINLPLGQVAAGFYMVALESEGGSVRERVVVTD
ncbi:MAG TPA: T9SS type A sorting domain-containing protein [Saprospiraceae bacterium]|nr:T9SS type A sorting domain-containing protein [Saprospiraceae bacterium]HMQ84601.1 T9SS type A sorting domain-containing protein [Saprospiraceae bacterium]